jgi:hypothetical protein
VLKTGWHNSDPGSDTAPCKSVLASELNSGDTAARSLGNYQNGSISGVKFEDKNANGLKDIGDDGLEGWTIYVDSNGNLSRDTGEPYATTASDGTYTISGVTPGMRTLREESQTGWTCSFPNPGATSPKVSTNCSYSVAVTSGNTASGKDFGNWTTGSVAGMKWEDKNANGVKDAGDGPLANWNIYVDYDGNSVKDAGEPDATTVADGTYTISGVKPGTWTLREVSQTGWTCSYPSPCSHQITVTSRGSVPDKNFGNWTTGTVSGLKFEDKNANHAQDTGDDGLPGWEIRAYVDTNGDGTLNGTEAATVAAWTTTGASGMYSLKLSPGAYVICEVAQTNWLQTKPDPATNTRCQSALEDGRGGYAVVATSSGSTTDINFGNTRFNSTSTMTDSAFQLVDDLTPWTITDFEILLNSSNTIVATNPGQFYYHQRGTNTSGATASMQFTINWPCQFVTQGAQPIHAYVQYASDSANTWRDFTPTSTGITWTNSPASGCPASAPASSGLPGIGTITVNNVPANAKVWVNVHLDYRLKGTTAPNSNFGNPPMTYRPFQSVIVSTGGSSASSTSLLGRGKKVTVVYGTLTNPAGAPLAGVWVRLAQGTSSALAVTGVDGFYVFYDGQGCSDGLEGCSAGLTSWNYGSGNNVPTTLAILGDDATPSASATYPFGRTSATVKNGTTTLATFAAPTAPSYSDKISKNSAYSRDWRFGP